MGWKDWSYKLKGLVTASIIFFSLTPLWILVISLGSFGCGFIEPENRTLLGCNTWFFMSVVFIVFILTGTLVGWGIGVILRKIKKEWLRGSLICAWLALLGCLIFRFGMSELDMDFILTSIVVISFSIIGAIIGWFYSLFKKK